MSDTPIPDFYRAIGHPLRRRILFQCAAAEACATELADLFEAPFKKVYAQMRLLDEAGLLTLVDTDVRQGGTQKFYRFVPGMHGDAGDDLRGAFLVVERLAHCEQIPESLQRSLLNVGKMLELVVAPSPVIEVRA